MKKIFKQKNNKYLLYGSSIIVSRGLEYFILFFAAHQMTKDSYGELEYYKKLIEVVSSIFAFGLPTLIMSYTKSKDSKVYFYFLSLIFISAISLITLPFLYFTNTLLLLIPFIFYALFFTSGLTPIYILVNKSSSAAAYYKILIAILFYATIFILITQFNVTSKVYIYVTYVLLPILSIWFIYETFLQKPQLKKLGKYWQLLKKLLLKSFSLVVSNFANMMFLYTDIFIIKLLAENDNESIANYSFALNIANVLMMIPLTLVQVDIEKLKKEKSYLGILNRRIVILVSLAAIGLICFYKLLTTTYFENYKETFYLFLVLLVVKLFHSFSTLYGTNLIIFKKFRFNLVLNVSMLLFNIVLSYVLFLKYDLYGVAIASMLSLAIRYLILLRVNKQLVKE